MNNEQEQTTENPDQPRKWVTVNAAFLICQDSGLERTKKTIRSWCRLEDVECQKQTTPTGERWMMEASSLAVKIRNELEFQTQNEVVQTSTNSSEPVHTSAHLYERTRTGATTEPISSDVVESERNRIEELEAQVQSLELDKAVRDHNIKFLSKQNEDGQESLLAQSRYIGHLETELLKLGGKPNSRFLEAPIPDQEAKINPNQPNLDIHE